MQKKISLFSLVLFIVSSIDSIRTLPATAFFGSHLIFYFLLSVILFLGPVSLISAEFAARFPKEGGVFHWIRGIFGLQAGVLAVWLQWVNTIVWYPAMLLVVAGTAAHMVCPSFAENREFLLFFSLVSLWGVTFLNLFGVRCSVWINSWCSLIGVLVPMALLILLGLIWVMSGKPLAIELSMNTCLPSFDVWKNSHAFITIMASFLGVELAGVYIGEFGAPRTNFPKAIACSMLILFGSLLLGSLAVAILIPCEEIRFIDGIMQAFQLFFARWNIPLLTSFIAGLIVIGSIGGSMNWLIAPSQGLLQIAEYRFLPSILVKRNRRGVAVRLLLLQSTIISLLCWAAQQIPCVNASYWFFIALSTGLYMLMYAMLFAAALKLGHPSERLFRLQLPPWMRTAACCLGLVSCFATMLLGFHPPNGIHLAKYILISSGTFCLLISPVFLLWVYHKRKTDECTKAY